MKHASVRRPNALVVCAGLGVSVAAAGPASAGVVTAHWLSPVSGTWNAAANWSTNPNFPNNGTPPGETYHAVIDATGAAYTVTLTATTTVDQLTVDSADATLVHTSGGLTAVNGLALNAGVLRLQNSTILNTVISSAGGSLATSGFSSALIDVTLGASLTIVGGHQMSIGGGSLILNNAMVSIDGNGSFTSLNFNGNQVLGGSGVIEFNGSASNNAVRSLTNVQSLTIGEDVVIRTGTQGGTVGLAGATLINQGTISAETVSQTLTVTGSNWSNTGLLRASAGTLALGGTIAVGGLGQIEATGSGVIALNGTLNNTGFTTVLDGVSSRLTLDSGGSIVGGTVTGVNGGALLTRVSQSSGLQGVTLGANLGIANAHTLMVSDGLTLDGSTISFEGMGGNTQDVRFNGTQTLGGSGVVVFNGGNDSNLVRSQSAGQTLTIGEDVTIRTGTRGGSVGLSTAGLVNEGVISAETATRTLNVTGSNWSNTGLLRSSAGTLSLQGTMAVGGLGQIEATGSGVIVLNGTLNNTGFTTVLDGVNSRLTLGNGSIVGGTVTALNGGSMSTVISASSGLQGVTLGANLGIANAHTLMVSDGLTLDGSTISFEGAGGNTQDVRFNGTQTLGGSGVVVFNGGNDSNLVRSQSAGQTLTIGEDVVIRTGTQGGAVGLNSASLMNQGTISAETASQSLTVTGTNWSNTGLLRSSAGTLQVQGSGFTNSGTIRGEGAGLARVTASGFNQQGTLEARSGGIVRVENGATLSNSGTLLAGTNGRIELVNGLTQTGSGTVEIELGGLAASQFGRLTITGAAALDGTLALTPVNGFAPDWGDAWTIMTFGSRTGDFASFDLPTLADADWTWWMEANAANYRVGVRHVADLNYDGAINFGDLNIVLGNYNESGSALDGDISGDGLINFADLNIVLGLFNLTAPTNVPAPGGAAVLAVVGLVGARRRRG